jgi:diacylglycerol kinase family enzyme
MVVAVGGDGTIADVLQGIIHSRREKRTILGLVPFGSGNAFRKSLGIPKDAKKAIPILSRGEYRDIDLIEVDGMVAGIASIGATAKATQVKLQHNIPGLFGHLLASRILVNYPRKEHEIELIDGIADNGEHFDKKILKLQLFDCIVGKTKYFGYSWKVAPKAKIDDGYLDITFFETSGVKYLLLFPFIYFGVLQKRQKHFKAKKMIIRGENLPVQYNGEFLGVKDKFEFSVLPQAMKVITPLKNDKNKFVGV